VDGDPADVVAAQLDFTGVNFPKCIRLRAPIGRYGVHAVRPEGYGRPMKPPVTPPVPIERVDVLVRMERKTVMVLEALADHRNMTLGELLEKIALHSFEAVPGQEGEMCASPYSKESLAFITDLKRTYGMDFDTHASRRFQEIDEGGASRT